MPDPTVKEFKTVHNREASKQDHHHSSNPPAPSAPSSPSEAKGKGKEKYVVEGDTGGSLSLLSSSNNETKNGKSDSESSEVVKAPSSWWAVSFGSLMSSIGSTLSPGQPSVTTTTTTVTTIITTEDETDHETESTKADKATSTDRATSTSNGDTQATSGTEAEAETSTETEAGNGNGTDKGTTGKGKKGTITKTTTSSTTVSVANAADKSVLTSTINSIKQQVAALVKAPPTDVISAFTYWWGYEIFVPHNCMSKLQRVTNTSQIFFGFLSGAVVGFPGLASLVPLSRIISAWVGFQWAIIQAEDLGNGVVLSATWVLPVALAPRSWDRTETVIDPEPAKIKAA
ncbi:hypothetical protein BGZ65_008499 [Modicella reniformis]|uniref:Uncharacterized protein n=1 Tax=Modicella reniformis TaxID=1440133 RepID=A0A9P6MKI3_9FUNG|nr:hypothetical protein BGZ65_008499 [Modicella reniformis]